MANEAKPEKHYLQLQEIVGHGRDVGEITAWLANSPRSRAHFRVRAENLDKTNRALWNKTQFWHIQGKLYEIKWKAEDKQWRALGFDFEGHFVMVLGCTHKGKVYTPPDWKKTALKRIVEVENGQWGRVEFKHIKEEQPSTGTQG
jgi:hypothetical protein